MKSKNKRWISFITVGVLTVAMSLPVFAATAGVDRKSVV